MTEQSRMFLRLVLTIVLLIGSISASWARPVLDHASPAAGSTLRHAPSQVALSFTEVLLPDSDAVVRNASGSVVSSGKVSIIGKKGEMQVPVMHSLSPGKYRVEWYATSPDRHPNQGSFNFVVSDNHPRRAATTGEGSSSYAYAIQRHPGVRRHRGHRRD